MKQKLILLTVLLPAFSAFSIAPPGPSYYTLTVNNGSGGGSYTNMQVVEISADAPITGRAFDRWIGDTQVVDNVTAASATVTMSTNAVSLTATYTNLPGWYTLTVNSGTGSGVYTNGQQVAIAPDSPPTGKAFSGWVDDEPGKSYDLTIAMPAQDYILTATYTNLPGWYTLTVTNGIADSGPHTNGTQVLITASNAPTGQAFDRWIGDTQVVDNVTAASATVTMSTNAVSLTATYTNLPGWYTLTVNNGTANSGPYTNGTEVLIAASNAPAGQTFDQWSGDTQYIASVTSSNTTVTMPAQDVSLTATYKDVYTLTVVGGTGGGAYPNGAQIEIEADAPIAGRSFDRWIGDTQVVDNVTASTATVTMSTNAVSLTATYTNLPGWFTLTVTNGTGGGAYTNGTQVLITANAPTGQAFNRWTGDTQVVDSVTSTNATVTMPAQDISLTATCTNLPGWYTLTVNNGTGSGTYTNETRVEIAPDAPPIGKAFSQWTDEDGSYLTSDANSTVIMPARNVSLTATYTNLPGWYTLTVTNGTGGGTYTNETQILIAASNAPTGQAFDRWIGDTQYVDSVASTNATVTMPTNAVSLTATYTNLPGWYTLTINNGIGGGAYTNETQVLITASNAPTGQAFDRWIGDTQYVDSVISTNATVTMPAQDISLTATYTNLPGWYTLTVNRGTGDGAYTNGARVKIVADAPEFDRAFSRWTGATQYVTSVTSSPTTLTMPAKNISITATYGAARYYLDVYRGAGDGFYTNGQKVAIVFWPFGAIIPPGWVFDRWTGDTQYVANVTSTTTIVTMPTAPVVCVADFRDIQKPVLTVSSPISGERVGGAVKVVGKVTDNDGATDIFIRLNGGGWMTNSVLRNTNGVIEALLINNQHTSRWTTNNGFSGTTIWTSTNNMINGPTTNKGMFGTTSWTNNLTLPFRTGTNNVLQVCARDATGNRSTTNTLNFFYVIAGDLNIQTSGPGTVVRVPTGVPEVGKAYTLTAVPSKTGSAFSNWSGDSTSTNRVLRFTMTSNKTFIANFKDIQKPTVVITAPSASLRILGTNGLFTVKGTATDNGVLSNVLVKLNGGDYMPAVTTNGGKNWNLPVTLVPGTNTIRAYSVDSASNNSLTPTVICTYVVTGALTVKTNGVGTIARTPTGAPEIGKTYTLTAAAGIGSVFSNWGGDSTSTNRVLRFTMTSSKTFTANFTDIQKPTVVITYPARLQRVVTNGAVVIRGTAADNGRLAGVKYQLHTGAWTNATSTNGWKNWTANFYPVTGLNTARVYSVDVQSNVSAISAVVFTYAPGAVMRVQTNGAGTITPTYNGQVLEIGARYTMTAKPKSGHVFTKWTYGIGGAVATNKTIVTFVMQSNLVLTANFSNLSARVSAADMAAVDLPSTAQAAITVDGSAKDWANVPCSSFSYASVTQEVAVALDGNNIALLLNGCPFGASDNVLVYFKLRLSYGDADNRHSVDLWTSGSTLSGMVDGQVITGLEAVLLNGVLEVKLPVEQTPSQVTIEELGCGMDLGGGTLTELFRLTPPPTFSP